MKSLFVNAGNSTRNGWKVLGFFILTAAFAVGLVLLRRTLPDAVRPFVPEPLLAFLGALAASWLCARLERSPLGDQGLALRPHAGRDLGLGVAGGAALVALVAFVVWLLDGFHWVRTPDVGASALVKSAWLMLGVALFEETLFHGYAFQRAIRGMGTRWALLVFCAIFAAMHPFEPGMEGSVIVLALLNISLAGWMLGLCYLRTGHLALPVGVHFGWNWLQGNLGFGVSGNASKALWTPVFHDRPVWLTGGDFGLEASVIGAGVLALAVAGLLLWKGAGARVAPPVDVPGYRVSGRA